MTQCVSSPTTFNFKLTPVSDGSTVVKHSLHNPKFKALSPVAAGARKENYVNFNSILLNQP
jgi:hypothetical protein